MISAAQYFRLLCACIAGALAALLLVLYIAHSGSVPARADTSEPVPFGAAYYASPSDRFGVGFNNGITVSVNGSVRRASISDYDITALHAGWYSA